MERPKKQEVLNCLRMTRAKPPDFLEQLCWRFKCMLPGHRFWYGFDCSPSLPPNRCPYI